MLMPQITCASQEIFPQSDVEWRCVMNTETRSVSEASIGSLGSCLLEGNSQDERGARRRKRRAFALAIAFQSLIVTAILLFPLLGKTEHIALNVRILPPSPHFGGSDPHRAPKPQPARAPACHFCAPTRIPPSIATKDPGKATDLDTGQTPIITGLGDPNGHSDGILNTASNDGPAVPTEAKSIPVANTRIRVGHIDPAQLIHRVEPIYPKLAIQIHHEGRVELRAVIAIDGSVQSLEVISGDPLLIQSALTAVRQWRYHPTYLNNIPVEVDTYVTVVYAINH
jgi:TonB family protein